MKGYMQGSRREKKQHKGSGIIIKLCSFNCFSMFYMTRYPLGISKIGTIRYWTSRQSICHLVPIMLVDIFFFSFLLSQKFVKPKREKFTHKSVIFFLNLCKEYSRRIMCVWNGEELSSVLGSHRIGRCCRTIHFILEDCTVIFSDLLINCPNIP